jgi:hypothetical protein
MKKDRKYIIILILTLSAFTFIEWLKPKPIDWSHSYSSKDKIPYGNYVLYSNLASIFPGKIIRPVVTTIYETTDSIFPTISREDTINYESSIYNYLFVTNEFSPGETDLNSLIDFIHSGNNVFIASESFSKGFEDSVHFKLDEHFPYGFTNEDTAHAKDSILLSFVNPVIKGNYYFKKPMGSSFFSSFDTLNTTVLGINENKEATFIKIHMGAGNLFLSSTPLVFTNYSMLDGNRYEYVSKALSYLPLEDVFWDEHFKMNRINASSPLKVILNYEPLRWAYFIAIGSMILFMIFEAKRRQRTIPVIEPLTNTTLEFVDTVGRLYYQNGNHKNIATKKITYFMDFIRNRYYLKTNKMDADFMDKLSEKSGKPLEEVKQTMEQIRKTNEKNNLSEEELIRLNAILEKFYN